MRDLCRAAVDAAVGAGASYADARAVVGARRASRRRTAASRTSATSRARESACASSSTAPGASPATGASTPTARATRRCARAPSRAPPAGRGEKALAPLAATSGTYRTPVEQDPFAVSLSDKVALCLRAEEALRHADVKVTEAFVRAQREHKVLVTSDGAEIEQELVETGGGIDASPSATAVFQIRSYPTAHSGSSAQAGWEYVEGLGLEREAPRVGEQAAALLRADVCPSGGDDGRDRRGADGAPGARVGRAPDRARPRLRQRGRVRGHELPQADRPRLAPLRLGADERHRRLDDARRARHLRVRRRGRAARGASRSSSRACSAASSPRARRPSGSARARAARCAPTAGTGCR